jgi:hypothetical protein
MVVVIKRGDEAVEMDFEDLCGEDELDTMQEEDARQKASE